jgi:hypothetical protein
MTAAGYARHDHGEFAFVEGQDAVFRPGLLPFDVTVLLEVKDKFATLLGQIADSMRDGKGVPYAAYQPEFAAAQDRLNAPLYEQFLVEDFLASVSGAVELLDAGAHVVDIGCGGGQALVVLAARFPGPPSPVTTSTRPPSGSAAIGLLSSGWTTCSSNGATRRNSICAIPWTWS